MSGGTRLGRVARGKGGAGSKGVAGAAVFARGGIAESVAIDLVAGPLFSMTYEVFYFSGVAIDFHEPCDGYRGSCCG